MCPLLFPLSISDSPDRSVSSSLETGLCNGLCCSFALGLDGSSAQSDRLRGPRQAGWLAGRRLASLNSSRIAIEFEGRPDSNCIAWFESRRASCYCSHTARLNATNQLAKATAILSTRSSLLDFSAGKFRLSSRSYCPMHRSYDLCVGLCWN